MIQTIFDIYVGLSKEEKLFFLLCLVFGISAILLILQISRAEKRYLNRMINVIELPLYIIIDKDEIVYSGGNSSEVLHMRIDELLQYKKRDLKIYKKTQDKYSIICYKIVLGTIDD